MKFVLKVLVLVCLIVVSKLAKDESVELHQPITGKIISTPVFTSNIQEPIAERQPSTVSVKFEKGNLQVN